MDNLKDRLVNDVKSYVNMRIDAAKLSVVEHLSVFTGKAIGLVVCLFLCNVALIFFAAAIAYGIGLLINSMIWGVVIVAVLFLLLGILSFMRPTFFINRMVAVFSHMFFCNDKKKGHEES